MELQRWKKVTARCLALLCAAAFALPAQALYADEVNLALNKPVEVTKEYEGTSKRLVDGNKTKDGRWMTEAPSSESHSAVVDLEKVEKVNFFEITWESDQFCGADFKLYASKDKGAWGEPLKVWKDSKGGVTRLKLDDPVEARYVKLEVTRMNGGYGVSVGELEVWNIAGEVPNPAPGPQDPADNIARKAHATTSSNEDPKFSGSKAVDGGKSGDSRWASATGSASKPAWIQLDFGTTRDVKTFRVYWETRKPKSVKFQYADGPAAPTKDSEWTTAETTGRPGGKTQTVALEQAVKARFVRVVIEDWDALDPDGAIEWDNISLYELEVYGGELEKSLEDWLGEIAIDPVTPETETLGYHLPEVPEGLEIKYNGTDYEQVIGAKGEIFRPIVDVTVNSSFKITDKESGEYAFREIAVKVPGSMAPAEGDNPAPRILPELREWKGATGSFKGAKRVVYTNDSLKPMAEQFADDFRAIAGVELQVVAGSTAGEGDILFALTDRTELGLQDEGYLLEAKADRINVTAEKVAGANWGAQTILQGVKQSGDGSFPCGTTRDYPLYKVRSFILDVGRKTFTLDYLKQVTKQLSWYKMNDFQVHLNDNLIFLESVEEPMKAYSGFRLESDIKKGGNGGKNMADLTSKDVWYSKADFKQFIEESKALGVNIVPEIDTPAHSLALTKVRPDLRYGTSGRENDHLDLKNQYGECLAFVQSIFGEYLDANGDGSTAGDDVFAAADVIHVGADEYNADPNAFRTFNNDMYRYIEDFGKTARVWGSLTHTKPKPESGIAPVEVPGVDAKTGKRRQINLWNFDYANMDEMYESGFELIDCNDGQFYIVPNAGYYFDYLGDTAYNDPLNSIASVTIPAGDPQVAGGAFAVWNDMVDFKDNGISEYDVYDRIRHSVGQFAANSWGKGGLNAAQALERSAQLGDAPGTDFGNEDVAAAENGSYAHWTMDGAGRDASGMGRDLGKLENASFAKVDGKQALKLKGGASFAPIADGSMGSLPLGSDVRVKVKRADAAVKDQILFESPYGSIKAVQAGTGKVGLSRENFDFSFNYELPMNEWVELEFKNEFTRSGVTGRGRLSLYVNGELIDTIGDGEQVQGRPVSATCMLPVGRVGSETSAFGGFVDDVRISKAGDFASTMGLDHLAITAEQVMKGENIDGMRELLDRAYALMREFAPSAEAVEALAGQIRGKLDAAPYERADYSRVNAYRQLVGNEAAMGLFEPAAAQRLKTAAAQVRDGLPASMQATVNAYENALVNALSDQKPLALRDLRVIDPSLLKAEANSEHAGETAAKVLDGNLDSIWHSDYPDNKLDGRDGVITISFKDEVEAKNVSGLIVTRRHNGGNGDLNAYRVEVSTDAKAFEEVASGTAKFENGDVFEIPFNQAKQGVRAVRLTYVGAGAGGFASAAEIRLIDADAKADVQGLRDIVDLVASIKKVTGSEGKASDTGAEFTDATWKALQQELGSARKLLEQGAPGVNEVETQKVALASALFALRLAGDSPLAPGEITVTVDDRIPGHEDLVLQVVEGDVLPDLPMPELAGYTFEGWYTDGAADAWKDKWDFSDPVERDMTLTAKWVESDDEAVGPIPGETEPPIGPEEPGQPQGPTDPGKPGGSSKPGSALPQTGDNTLVAVGGVGLLAVAAIIVGVIVRRRNK